MATNLKLELLSKEEQKPLVVEGITFYPHPRYEQKDKPLNDLSAAETKQGYLTYCAQCHGNHHDGKGTVGQSFAPLPGDLRSKKVQTMPEGVMFQEISYGIPKGRQPALATTIAVEDRWKIIAYIKSLGIRK